MYFGHARARHWFAEVAAALRDHPALTSGAVEVFVLPTYLQVATAVEAFHGTAVRVGAQDVAGADEGAFTGEVSAAELAEVGAALAAVGHAERRRLFGETDDLIGAKAAAALRAGLTALICVGGEQRDDEAAAAAAVAQLDRALAEAPEGRVLVAYEPVWAIGASEAAAPTHIETVTRALRQSLGGQPGRVGSAVLYGGSAGPGLLTELGDAVDGLFLGRFAHDPAALIAVIDEAHALLA
jgi:triosephosphate isomerase (TIM)